MVRVIFFVMDKISLMMVRENLAKSKRRPLGVGCWLLGNLLAPLVVVCFQMDSSRFGLGAACSLTASTAASSNRKLHGLFLPAYSKDNSRIGKGVHASPRIDTDLCPLELHWRRL